MKKADVILLCVLLIIGITGCIIFMISSHKGVYVTVAVNGEKVATYSLRKDGEYLIKTENGAENLLCIEGESASVVSANCPNQDCVRHKAITAANEYIVCLPHKLLIFVCDNNNSDIPDAYVQ